MSSFLRFETINDNFDKACRAGLEIACFQMGMVLKNDTSKFAQKHFRPALEKACAKAYGPGCMELAIAYEMGIGGPKDPKKAFEAAEKACDVEWAEGCLLLARYYKDGIGCEPDEVEARISRTRACDLGTGEACD